MIFNTVFMKTPLVFVNKFKLLRLGKYAGLSQAGAYEILLGIIIINIFIFVNQNTPKDGLKYKPSMDILNLESYLLLSLICKSKIYP